jgi:hypothetical protein
MRGKSVVEDEVGMHAPSFPVAITGRLTSLGSTKSSLWTYTKVQALCFQLCQAAYTHEQTARRADRKHSGGISDK